MQERAKKQSYLRGEAAAVVKPVARTAVVGAGVMGFLTQNVGLRGDVRYFRGFRGTSDNLVGLGVSNFNFWRTSIGVSFKF